MSAVVAPGEEAPRKHTRSRTGCVRCKRRRQKCNQEKPSCGRCVAAGSPCKYEIKLNWGGRPFQKSSFGKCLENVEKLDDVGGGNGFIYSLVNPSHKKDEDLSNSQTPSRSFTIDLETTQISLSRDMTIGAVLGSEVVPRDCRLEPNYTGDMDPNSLYIPDTISAALPHSLDHTSFLPPMVRYLLQFYLTETMRLTVPSAYARTEICRFVVPLSLQEPCLLYAIMAFASIHLKAMGKLPGNAEKVYDTMQRNSIRHLHHQLEKRDPISRAVSLATARTLCQAQIYGGKPSWRAHLNDARSILQSAHFRNEPIGSCSCGSIKEFLSSWYNNAEALAALTPVGLLSGQLEVNCLTNAPLYFDVFGGVMSDLPDLFREVGALVKERRRRAGPRTQHAILSEGDIAAESDALIREIHFRLERDAVENLSLSPQILALSTNEIQDYALSNAGFLYTALLHLYCGVQGLASSAPEAQFCVEQIIRCAESMNLSSGLSPRVLLVSPLFTAGLCAIGPARESIKFALTDIGQWMKTPHLIKTLALLEQIWLQFAGDSEEDVWSWFERVNFDFLPY
ncbi:fungal-specific transcription factor domain-containing protein [Ilyonectria robusta]|uniref:fungal-specific transcription factor domain-containing protein n=1 Tax=Ilyonectria robusta TaxID=1079257 RepID=UPI001E8D3C7A|nr:fungal-specific transcription factor domain-containing protein [Ilyonectria robusta]KAH8658946.1 fungal-specific transcription factor domain-containing protein [Ilyonectria robusta]